MTHAHLTGQFAPINFTGEEMVEQILSDLESVGESESYSFEYAVNNGIIHVDGKTREDHVEKGMSLDSLTIFFSRDTQEDLVELRWLLSVVTEATEDTRYYS